MTTYSSAIEKCHQRADPMVWHKPGMPSHRGRHGVVLGGPDAVLRHRTLEAELFRAWSPVAIPLQPRGIRQDLDAPVVRLVVGTSRPGEARAGSRFDLREFHDVVLRERAMPPAIVERVVDDYVTRKKIAQN